MKIILCTLLVMLCCGLTAHAQGAPGVQSWAALLDAARNDATLQPSRETLLAGARKAAAREIVRRVYKYEDVGKYRTALDGRAKPLEPEIQETFALAMSDANAGSVLADELPLLAAAYRLSGDETFRNRLVAQLEEVTAWSPLQRPGWTLYQNGNRMPAGGDGNWLGTGWAIRGLCDAIEILPPGSLDPALHAKLDALLEKEIASIADDWNTKRPWFVKGDNPATNQWVLPTEGLVRACLLLGVDKHRKAYEMGVANLLRSLDVYGPNGEFPEGLSYASMTLPSLLHTGHALALAGDRRALEHPFLRQYPLWLVHHMQPGRFGINAFDAGSASFLPRSHGGMRDNFTLLLVCSGSPVARWALWEKFDGPLPGVAGLAASAMRRGDAPAPPLWAHYPMATRVNWRDSWEENGNGVWVRGGHPIDGHDHHDRGHVNYIAGGKPLLIEAGTPPYDHPQLKTHFQEAQGHNVLQIGDAQPLKGKQGAAPIAVRRLDAGGGDVQVDASACYPQARHWRRDVTWDAAHLSVRDDVELKPDQPLPIRFRWHLGASENVTVEGSGRKYLVRWPDAAMEIETSAPVVVTTESLPDRTLNANVNQDHRHVCVVITLAQPAGALQVTTTVRPVQ